MGVKSHAVLVFDRRRWKIDDEDRGVAAVVADLLNGMAGNESEERLSACTTPDALRREEVLLKDWVKPQLVQKPLEETYAGSGGQLDGINDRRS